MSIGSTPLHLAARKGHTAAVEILLLSRATVDARSLRGMTALHDAVETSQINVLELLIAHGADCMIPDARERTLMHIALSEGHQAVLALLLRLGSQRGKRQLLLLAETSDTGRKQWQTILSNRLHDGLQSCMACMILIDFWRAVFDVRTSGRPDVGTSGRRDVRTSGRPYYESLRTIFREIPLSQCFLFTARDSLAVSL